MKRLWFSIAIVVLVQSAGPPPSARAQPSVAPALSSEFSLDEIGGGFLASMTQMAFGPDGWLYVSTWHDGVVRFDYDPSGDLPAPVQAADLQSLGLAFHDSPVHGPCMYLTIRADAGGDGRLLRLTDDDGDGVWGEGGETRVAIAQGIPVGSHRLDQLQIRGDTLWVGIGTRTDQGDNESSYNGNIAWIQDLDAVPSVADAAGFPGVDFFADATPYLSTAADRLVVHSSGSRNPFGLALDGDGGLWMTNNQLDTDPTPADEIFRCSYQADYGFPAANPSVDWRTHPDVLAAGFFDPVRLTPSLTLGGDVGAYEPDVPTPGPPPGSLGPHSSADGFDFYDGNEFPLRFHKDAFVTRASSSSPGFTGLSETYEDIVAVDRNTGEVVQIADDFNRPLDVIEDGSGQVLIAEFHRFGNGQGRMYRLSASTPAVGAHAFDWGSDDDGDWFDRLQWNVAVPANDRLAPHQWGSARYSVSVDRPGASPVVSLDRTARVASLTLGDELALAADGRLTIDQDLTMKPDAAVTIQLDAPVAGKTEPFGGPDPRIDVGGVAQLAGALTLGWSGPMAPGAHFLLVEASEIQGSFGSVQAPGQVQLQQEQIHEDVQLLWVTVLSGTGGPSIGAPPVRSRVLGNHPNPFNPSTRIDFRVELPGRVRLSVHDGAGRRVALLLDRQFEPGSHSTTWGGLDASGSPVASGVYFVRMRAPDGSSIHRMTLLK